MADVPHNFVEFQGDQSFTTLGVWAQVTNQNITSGNFTVGRKYLIVATNKFEGGSVSADMGTRILHGTTVFPHSQARIQSRNNSNELYQYIFIAVWTAVSGEGISMEAANLFGTATHRMREAAIFTLEISEEFTEGTDWHFNENDTDADASTTFSTADNATVTFTPPSAGDDWLIIGFQEHEDFSTSSSFQNRMRRTGEASETTQTSAYEGEFTGDKIGHMNAMVKNLGASSNTFDLQFANDSGSAWSRDYGAIFAINLSLFASHVIQHDTSTISANNANDDLGDDPKLTLTQAHTPSLAGDVWAFLWAIHTGSTVSYRKARMQIDNADNPPGQTTLNLRQGMGHDGNRDRVNFVQQTVDNLSAASHTWDVDCAHGATTAFDYDQAIAIVRLSTTVAPKIVVVVPESKIVTTLPP